MHTHSERERERESERKIEREQARERARERESKREREQESRSARESVSKREGDQEKGRARERVRKREGDQERGRERLTSEDGVDKFEILHCEHLVLHHAKHDCAYGNYLRNINPFVVCQDNCFMTVSTENATPPKSSKSKNSNFAAHIQTKI